MEEWKMVILYMLSAKITLLLIQSPCTRRSKQWNYEGLINTDQYLSGKLFDWMLREGIWLPRLLVMYKGYGIPGLLFNTPSES